LLEWNYTQVISTHTNMRIKWKRPVFHAALARKGDGYDLAPPLEKARTGVYKTQAQRQMNSGAYSNSADS
jgi:hypothetical protein